MKTLDYDFAAGIHGAGTPFGAFREILRSKLLPGGEVFSTYSKKFKAPTKSKKKITF